MDRAQEIWERLLENLSAAIAGHVVTILSSTVLSEAERISSAAAVIAAGQRRSVTAADVHLATELTLQLSRAIRPTGVDWMEDVPSQTARIATAVTAVIDDKVAYADTPDLMRDSIATRLRRFVDGQVTEAATWGRGEAGDRHAKAGTVIGWIRRTDNDPCELCQTFRGSPPAVHPTRHRIALHQGRDRCSQQFVTSLAGYGKWVGTRKELRELLAAGH